MQGAERCFQIGCSQIDAIVADRHDFVIAEFESINQGGGEAFVEIATSLRKDVRNLPAAKRMG